MNAAVIKWAVKHNVSHAALAELSHIFGMAAVASTDVAGASEAAVQSMVRLEAANLGNVKLWRNNVGALEDKRGNLVRYGLANDSPRLNKSIKSADLIGWRSLIVLPGMVGSRIAQFVSRECKRPGWQYTGDEHEEAQRRWIEVITADGGDACFCTGRGTL